MERIIMHIDVNNAFLSWTAVHMLKNGYPKDIRKEYAVIGGDEKLRKGVVLAKSLPAKKKGVITGEPLFQARRKCPYLNVYPTNTKVYRYYSWLMYKYLLKYSPTIERYSIDECFLDYTESQKLFGDPYQLACKIKEDIKKYLGFTVNVGIGNNKLCAKMASDFEKPDKVHTLYQDEIKEKMWPLSVDDLFMVGKQTATKLHALNINTIAELAKTDLEFLKIHFKSFALTLWNFANGIDNSLVEPVKPEQKSISMTTVLPYDYEDKVSNYEEEDEERKFFGGKKGKVVPFNAQGQSVKMVISQPTTFEQSEEICSLLKEKKSVIVNLEYVNKDVARRIVDFISGGVYALDGHIQKISNSIFLIAPMNYEITNEMAREEIKSKLSVSWLKNNNIN